jgi:5'-nucleotidase
LNWLLFNLKLTAKPFHYYIYAYFCNMTKPLILVTNDDGIVAPGIRALVEVASQIGEVIVVAPDSPQSGKGHAISIHDPLRLKKVKVFEGIEAWECSGTPVDCVKLAKHVVLKGREISLCVSGINHGSNASINILYSGTMSAAMEASVEGIRSIGFSLLDFSFEADFEPAKHWAYKIMTHMLTQVAASGVLLNVNIPKLPLSEIKGMRVCRQADGKWIENFVEGRDPMGKIYYWLSGEFQNQDQAEDTDIWALENAYVSIVPSMHDLTDIKSIPLFKDLENA